MTNKERLEANNAKIEEITKTLANKQVSPTDMLQARIDSDTNNSAKYLFAGYTGDNLNFAKNLDTSNVTNMQDMFYYTRLTNFTGMENLNTSNVTNMSYMFQSSSGDSVDLSNWDMKKVTTMEFMFQSSGIKNVKISGLNLDSLITMANMFKTNNSVVSIDLSNCYAPKLKTMSGFFDSGGSGLTSANLSNFNAENLTNINNLFYYCRKLTDVNLLGFNTNSIQSFSLTFNNCKTLPTLDLSSFNTKNGLNFGYMFVNCEALTTIVGKLNLINATSVGNMFSGCKALTDVTLENIKLTLQLGSGTTYGTKISDNTLINTIQQLWDNTDNALGGSRTLTLSTASKTRTDAIYVKLIDVTDDMRAEDEYIDNKKPCVVCESTDEGAMTLKEYAISKNWNIA